MDVWLLKEQAALLSLAIDAQAKVTFTNGFDMNTQTQEALRMAIEYLTNIQLDYKGHEVRKALQEALERYKEKEGWHLEWVPDSEAWPKDE